MKRPPVSFITGIDLCADGGLGQIQVLMVLEAVVGYCGGIGMWRRDTGYSVTAMCGSQEPTYCSRSDG